MTSLPFIEKYRANNLNQIKGQDSAIAEARMFLKMFPKKKALIINGPAGNGKTSIVLALAKENDMELFELNASDLRNRASLEAVLKPASLQNSLFKKSKIILMDEADGITGTDRGGVPELIALIEKTKFPIIITANDIWDKKFSLLRQKCQIINLRELNENIVLDIITEVVKKECKKITPENLVLIANKCKGDIRAALNDLESVLNLGEEMRIENIDEREKDIGIFEALKKIFQMPLDKKTLEVFDDVDMEIDEIMLWMEENIPSEYYGKPLAKAYDSLSKADLFKGRIYRQQYWRFLVYQNFFLSAGISASTKLKNKEFKKYNRPTRILKIWMANQKNAKKKSLILKYARFNHMSVKKAMKEYFLLPLIINEKMKKTLDLDDNEIDYLQDKRGALILSSGLNKFRV
ncbi:MAG: replication factor C large subunit [Candidatus Nanoarchaeia archaeon]|nr:replication factor C large subunit [Candidatus Nanoarchaeia archaeon]